MNDWVLDNCHFIRQLGFQPLVIIAGPTASGKTGAAVHLAAAGLEQGFEFEIISIDSRQVYRGMDIGTGKESEAYRSAGIKVHMLDIAEPGERIRVAGFCRIAAEILKRKRPFILSGGSHFYLKTLLFGLPVTDGIASDHNFCEQLEKNYSTDQLAAWLAQMDPHNFGRTDLSSIRRIVRSIEISLHGGRLDDPQIPPEYLEAYLPVGVYPEVEPQLLKRGIRKRLLERLDDGMIEEGRQLHSNGLTLEQMARFGLEYEWLSKLLAGQCTREELVEGLSVDIGRFAKSQRTFLRHLAQSRFWGQWYEAANQRVINASSGAPPTPEPEAIEWWRAHGRGLFGLHPVPGPFPAS